MVSKLPWDNGCSHNIRHRTENLSQHIDPGTGELAVACRVPLFLKSVVLGRHCADSINI